MSVAHLFYYWKFDKYSVGRAVDSIVTMLCGDGGEHIDGGERGVTYEVLESMCVPPKLRSRCVSAILQLYKRIKKIKINVFNKRLY